MDRCCTIKESIFHHKWYQMQHQESTLTTKTHKTTQCYWFRLNVIFVLKTAGDQFAPFLKKKRSCESQIIHCTRFNGKQYRSKWFLRSSTNKFNCFARLNNELLCLFFQNSTLCMLNPISFRYYVDSYKNIFTLLWF